MVDLVGASASAGILIAGKADTANHLPMIAMEKKEEIQNTGVYDKIFPYLRKDFATRVELLSTLQLAFLKHNMTNMHFGLASRPGQPSDISIIDIPRETVVDTVKVRAGSPVNAIGYSV